MRPPHKKQGTKICLGMHLEKCLCCLNVERICWRVNDVGWGCVFRLSWDKVRGTHSSHTVCNPCSHGSMGASGVMSFWSEPGFTEWGVDYSRNEVKVAQSCPALCDPMDCTVHGIFQARILEWVAVPFSRGSSQPRDQTQVSHTAGGFSHTVGGFFTSWARREALLLEVPIIRESEVLWIVWSWFLLLLFGWFFFLQVKS